MATTSAFTKWESLTVREREVVRHIAKGTCNKTMAKSLDISLKTVEFHITNILKKLEMNSRAEIIVWVFEEDPEIGDT